MKLLSDGLNLGNLYKPVVAVHPFWREYFNSKLPEPYVTNFAGFLRSHEGPLITLEHSAELSRTEQSYRELGVKSDAYFVPWSGCASEEIWKGLKMFLEQFRGRPFGMIGGCITGLSSDNPSGCLGYAYCMLKEEGLPVEVIPELIFS